MEEELSNPQAQRTSLKNYGKPHILNDLLKNPTSRRQDHHFEAMILTNKLIKQLENVPVLLTEVAAIDEFRFNRLINRDYSSRDRIVIEEIALANGQDAIDRYITRENKGVSESESQIKAAITSTEDALKIPLWTY